MNLLAVAAHLDSVPEPPHTTDLDEYQRSMQSQRRGAWARAVVAYLDEQGQP